MPDTPSAKPAAKREAARWAVRATNDATGEIWSIHDTRAVCEEQLVEKLADWKQPDARVEWANLTEAPDA